MENTVETAKSPSDGLRVKFEVLEQGKSQTFLVSKDRIVFGSVESADIRLDSKGVAPIHAILEIDRGASPESVSARLIDLASPTGVMVNGSPLVNGPVATGDRIQIGEAVIRFGFIGPEEARPLPDQSLLLIDPATVAPIFDYRPAIKDALEVVCSWNGVILDVRHERDEESFVPGEGVVDSVGTRVTRQGRSWVLLLDPGLSGVLYLGGRLIPVEEHLRTHRAAGPVWVVIGENDFVRIQSGAVSFHFSRTVPPPVLAKKGDLAVDPLLFRILLVSLSFTILSLFGVSRLEITATDPPPVTETVATILYHPEKYSSSPPRPETPKPVPVKLADETKSKKPTMAEKQAKEGAGARAKGSEGSRGEKIPSKTATPQTAAKRTSPEPKTGRGGTRSESEDHGNLEALKGASNRILDLLGGSGKKLGASGSKLEGFGGFANQGSGGAALQGSGKGGGGSADTLLGGLAGQGRGGGRIGTGLGARGTGAGIVGGKTRVDLSAGFGNETVVIGSIDREAIDAAIRAHRDEFRYCYEHEVNSGNPDLAGKIVPAFVIGGSGRASQMAIASSSMRNSNVEKCVLEVISRIQFPIPGGGVPVSIKYPFAFTNASK